MKRQKVNTGNIKVSKIVFILTLFFFIAVIIQMARLSLFNTIDGVNLKKFASNRDTAKETLYASRGNIFSSNGEALAQDVNSYTVIAYLSPKRDNGSKTPKHVVDKEKTAEALSPLINMSTENILNLLNRKNLYQVELGPGGKGITEITKENIEKLQLPGIDFIQTYKRYYPNNDFLSYTLGYVVRKDDKLVGEMGIERYYDDYLKGKDGYLEYQKDLNGYRIPNTPEVKKNQVDGMDIYLTIDTNIQLFIERVVKEAYQTYNPDWMLMTVVDAKTGKILGTSSSPSFDPNIKDISSYLDPLVSYAYEPGSTMKTFTYMAAMEKGTYQGDKSFMSGQKDIADGTIYDWNKKGWGSITYDSGFALSSNTGAASILENFINRNDLKDYLTKLGFGSKTNITLPGEVKGKINFRYPMEVASAAFGQGITVTPIQFLQALTPIANNGTMLKPYIIDKIINPDTGDVVYNGKRTELGAVAKPETIAKIKDLMYNVINGTSATCTGYAYKIDGYDIIGKTGTAQYVDPKTGKYETGTTDYIKSFAGMFPKDNPQVIIYAVAKHPSHAADKIVSNATKRLISDLAKYLNVFPNDTNQDTVKVTSFDMPNLMNMNVNKVEEALASYQVPTTIIGDGTKVINQYPVRDTKITNYDHVFVITNNANITMPNMLNWSSRDALTYCNLTGISCQFNNYGYVSSQSIPTGSNINSKTNLSIDLSTKIQ